MRFAPQAWRNSAFQAACNSLHGFGNLSFLWIPGGDERNVYTDRVTNVVGRVTPSGAFSFGGSLYPRANVADNYITFDTAAEITGTTTNFFGFMLVSVPDKASVTGAFLKIGSTSNGIGFGGGNSTFENSGTEAIVLYEGVSWNALGSANVFNNGLNIISFGKTNEGVTVMKNLVTDLENSFVSASWLTPSASLQINGYTTNRGSNCTVHAVAIYIKSFTNAQHVTFRDEIKRPFLPFAGINRQNIMDFMRPVARIYSFPTAAVTTSPKWPSSLMLTGTGF